MGYVFLISKNPRQNINSKKQDIRKEKPSNRQYDWTYQTSYKGSIRGEKSVKSDPGALCDLENLKKRETIGWYRDIRLYDDELDDNGAVSLGVKIRVMPSCFFILVRYYLRVDKGKLQLHSVYLGVDSTGGGVVINFLKLSTL